MTSMNYGEMPSREMFDEHFEKAMEGKILYELRFNSSDGVALANFKLGTGLYNASELYECCKEIVEYEPQSKKFRINHDRAMDIVSSILYTLKMEWI